MVISNHIHLVSMSLAQLFWQNITIMCIITPSVLYTWNTRHTLWHSCISRYLYFSLLLLLLIFGFPYFMLLFSHIINYTIEFLLVCGFYLVIFKNRGDRWSLHVRERDNRTNEKKMVKKLSEFLIFFCLVNRYTQVIVLFSLSWSENIFKMVLCYEDMVKKVQTALKFVKLKWHYIFKHILNISNVHAVFYYFTFTSLTLCLFQES